MARPRLHDDSATASIHVRLTPGQRLELRRVAAENGTGVAGVIREAVNEYVADYRETRKAGVFRSPKP
jgi:hypothetical protein